MSFIISKMLKYKSNLILSLLLKAFGTMADLILPFLIAYTIDELLPNIVDENIYPLINIGLVMLFVAVAGWLLNITANRKAEKVAASSVADTRAELFRKIEGLSAKDVDLITTTSLISRMTTDTYNLYSMSGSIQRLGIRAPLLLVGGIIMVAFIDPLLMLIMMCLLPIIAFITYTFSKKGQPLYKDIQTQVDCLIRTLRENITGVRVVRALSMTDYEKKRFENENYKTTQKEIKATMTMAKIGPSIDVIMNIGLVIILVVGAYRVSSASLQVGQMLALVTYFTLILNAMMSVTRIFILIARANASSGRILEVLKLESTIKDGSNDIVVNDKYPHIEFDNVSFSYHDLEDHLENISFKLFSGQTLGIIGATGSGKTTILNLLMRFYDVKSGQIRLYGQNIKDLKLDSLRRHIGLVLQNDSVFSESIYENVAFSRDEITFEDVNLALEISQASFINSIPERHEHKISQRGTNISGGQRQRLLIARAIAGKPKVLILDDASSALDYQTDRNLRKAINDKLPGITKIIVAQRVASIKDADHIIMIEDGKMVASGKHSDLIKQSSHYQILVEHQMGGLLDE